MMLKRVSTTTRAVSTRELTFPAPIKGWVQAGNTLTAKPDQAEVLENWFPTAQGAKMRGGAREYANIGATVVRLMVRSASTDKLFAATATGIYDADRINSGGAVFPDIAGLASGDWSATQISTNGGDHLVAVNGSDAMQVNSGSGFFPVDSLTLTNLPFDTQTVEFQVGQTITGGTSGATGTLVGIAHDTATSGTLRLKSVLGVYLNNETITGAVGSALVNGAASAGSSITATGIATTSLSQVWLFKQRLFFIVKNTLNARYLPTGSIGGALTDLPLGSVFRRGGTLLFGATWSLDAGDGLDDVCVFVTTNGELAVFSGTDPASASTWSLTGVYDISTPVSKHGWFKAGGDMAILTDDGIIPVSEALRKDRAALQAVAITKPIEDAWKSIVSNRTSAFDITPVLWQDQAMMLIGTAHCVLVANARTGAWCKFTGWDFRCGAVANGNLYFGNTDGIVAQGNSGGADLGLEFTARYVPKFQASGTFMTANTAHVSLKAPSVPNFAADAFADYQVGSYTPTASLGFEAGTTWGDGSEYGDGSTWGDGAATYAFTVVKGISASGYSIAPALSFTSNQTTTPTVELLVTRVRYENGSEL